MTAPDLDLEALREVVDAGTQGPWQAVGYYIRRPDGFAIGLANQRDDNSPTDAALIVAAVNNLPVLIDALEEAREQRDKWRVKVDGDWLAQLTDSDLMTVEGRQAKAAAEEEIRSLRTKHIRYLGDEVDALTADRDRLRAEVARLTAVVQGVRDELVRLASDPGIHDRWREILLGVAGGTDTPKGTE